MNIRKTSPKESMNIFIRFVRLLQVNTPCIPKQIPAVKLVSYPGFWSTGNDETNRDYSVVEHGSKKLQNITLHHFPVAFVEAIYDYDGRPGTEVQGLQRFDDQLLKLHLKCFAYDRWVVADRILDDLANFGYGLRNLVRKSRKEIFRGIAPVHCPRKEEATSKIVRFTTVLANGLRNSSLSCSRWTMEPENA